MVDLKVVDYKLVDYKLVEARVVDHTLVDHRLADPWVVDHRLVDRMLMDPRMVKHWPPWVVDRKLVERRSNNEHCPKPHGARLSLFPVAWGHKESRMEQGAPIRSLFLLSPSQATTNTLWPHPW